MAVLSYWYTIDYHILSVSEGLKLKNFKVFWFINGLYYLVKWLCEWWAVQSPLFFRWSIVKIELLPLRARPAVPSLPRGDATARPRRSHRKKNQEKIGYCDQCPWMTLEENILCSLLSKTVYQATNKASLSIITAPRIYQAEIIPSAVNENCLKVRRCNKW